MTSTTTKATAFGGPLFGHASADTILQSSDEVDFFVYRDMLSTSSPIFKTMFTLPQPTDVSETEKKHPTIKLTEDSKTIEALLTYIYREPLVSATTEPESLDDMIGALVAAKKYDMAAVTQHLSRKFAESKVVQDDPIVAFCAAYTHELGEAARVAAKASLKYRMNLDTIADKLQYVDGLAFYQLYKFHRTCSGVAATTLSSKHLDWITPADSWGWDFPDDRCKCPRHWYTVELMGSSQTTWKATFVIHDYIKRARVALQEHPCREALAELSFVPTYEEDEYDETCENCLYTASPSMPEFRRLLGDEVEKRVSKVKLFLAHLPDMSYLMVSTVARNQVAILTFCSLFTMYNEATLKLLSYYAFLHTVVQVVWELQSCNCLKLSPWTDV